MDMKDNRKKLVALAALGICMVPILGGCGHVAFTHAAPGTAVDVKLAKRAEVVPTPTPKPVAVISPNMPSSRESMTETIADYFTLGNLMMQEQKYTDAIKAYESAVKLDPTFSEAWNHLAICYQDTGQSKKAVEAFKKYKMITQRQ